MRRRNDSWKTKVHAVFIETTHAYKTAIDGVANLGSKPPAQRIAEIHLRFRKELGEILVRHPNPPYAPTADDPLEVILDDCEPSVWPPSESAMDIGQAEVLYWGRFREPLKIALKKARRGEAKTIGRISRLAADRVQLYFGTGIKRSKTDPHHDAIFGLGLDLGLSGLTDEELADCFQAVCPCGKLHDADALKKQRCRKEKELERAREWLAMEAAKIASRERMAVYGSHEVYAKAARSTELPQRRVYVGEIGKRPACYLDERGDVFNMKGSKVDSGVAEELPRGFCLSTSEELFAMFFPPKRKVSSYKAKR